VDRVRERIAARDGKLSLDITTADKKERRAHRERDLGAKQVALPTRKYGVIVADPEWRFEPWSRETGMDRAADNHYPTSSTEVIAARDVPSIAAEDCVLFLWGTVPMARHAFTVMEAWGFEYRSQVIWLKPVAGTGYWFRNMHEILLVGTRGKPPAPAPGTQPESVIMASSDRHSAKPEYFLDLIERYFPTLPKIELNRRGPARPGWDAWGNEAERPTGTSETNTESVGTTAHAPAMTTDVHTGGERMGASSSNVVPVPDDDLSLPNFLRRDHPDCTWRTPLA
jgi:N6-adenosine-specific RNA methylase IME4